MIRDGILVTILVTKVTALSLIRLNLTFANNCSGFIAQFHLKQDDVSFLYEIQQTMEQQWHHDNMRTSLI